ncbi:glycosyltransferase [Caldisphaera lagunensis DSM 15908]|uniref:Glycosyltransferase n=1 Tax=Caldisphaera lagunensis (strain DSM 15908 / JCM 11604 / ANMR 0165 / IC-154) TaxID=1056495 RepID=L0ACC1_CALLD|nr:glycosyltransferase [Caldisphaera lagunensis]AFZ70685.1 glycosyltransferase [Caldisphaera lagunensis DSM 15908]
MKEKIAIIHALFDEIGGGEKLALSAIDALVNGGYDVKVYTGTKVDQEKIKNILGYSLKNDDIIHIKSKLSIFLANITGNKAVRLRRLMIYRKLFNKEFLNKLRDNYDLIIDTQSNLPTPTDITYIHFPATIGTTNKRNFIEKLYDDIVSLASKGLTKTRPGRTLTNSKWTANKIYKEFGIIADILYPPVDLDYFSKVSYGSHNNKKIITISRFSPEKGLDKIVDIAKQLKEFDFYIVGATTPVLSDKVINTIKNKIKNENVKNVFLMPDLPRNELLKIMEESKIYLHPPFAEHFGISIVEAMASGLVPVVYKDGGGWYDIVSNIDKNLGYKEINEAANSIKYAYEKYDSLKQLSINISKKFSREEFKLNILKMVNYALEIKQLEMR